MDENVAGGTMNGEVIEVLKSGISFTVPSDSMTVLSYPSTFEPCDSPKCWNTLEGGFLLMLFFGGFVPPIDSGIDSFGDFQCQSIAEIIGFCQTTVITANTNIIKS